MTMGSESHSISFHINLFSFSLVTLLMIKLTLHLWSKL